jgi:hypothetical protein
MKAYGAMEVQLHILTLTSDGGPGQHHTMDTSHTVKQPSIPTKQETGKAP